MSEKHKIKVLLISPNRDIGGISQWTHTILDYCNTHPCNIQIHNLASKPLFKEGVLASTPLLIRIFKGLIKYIPLYKSAKDEIRRNKYDIVHICSSGSFGLIRDFFLSKLCKKYNTPLVLHFHFGRIPEILKTDNWENKLLKSVLKNTSRVIVLDIKSFNAIVEFGITNVSLCPNPLSAKVANLVKRYETCKRDPHKLLFAGHVVKTKGIFELIDACKDIKDIKLTVLGKCEPEIHKMIQTQVGSNCEWLTIAGNCSLEDVIHEMKSSSLFILPTYTEGFPYVIIESMACACPIITTPVGAIPEILEFDSPDPLGISVPAADVSKLKIAIESSLNNPAVRVLGLKAKEKVTSSYSIDKVWNKIITIWSETKNDIVNVI